MEHAINSIRDSTKGDQVPNLYSSKDGVLNGLTLKLYIASVDDFFSFKHGHGAQIYIHNKSTVPSFFNGYSVSVNAETTLLVKREFNSALPSLYTNCVLDTESYGSIFISMFASNGIEYSQKESLKY
jgi:hypothetical protein